MMFYTFACRAGLQFEHGVGKVNSFIKLVGFWLVLFSYLLVSIQPEFDPSGPIASTSLALLVAYALFPTQMKRELLCTKI